LGKTFTLFTEVKKIFTSRLYADIHLVAGIFYKFMSMIEMGRACSSDGEEERHVQGFSGET
jgi:hypothetical protein